MLTTREMKNLLLLALVLASLAGCTRQADDPVNSLKSGSRAQRLRAMDALKPGASQAERDALLVIFLDEQEEGIVRQVAGVTLGRLHDPKILPAVFEKLPYSILHAHEIDMSGRGLHPHMLGKALLAYGDDTITVLAPLLESTNQEIVAWAVYSHGFYRGSDTGLSVISRFLGDPRLEVRRSAAGGLSQLFHRNAEG